MTMGQVSLNRRMSVGRATRRERAGARVALGAAALLATACGTAAAAPPHAHTVALVTTVQFPAPPPPTANPATPQPAAGGSGVTSSTIGRGSAPPSYALVDHLDAPTVDVHIPVVSVGVVHGAMDAPEGPLGSPFWREGFWLSLGAVPGNPGTATIAGHLDDTAGRPAAFWNIRNLHTGDEFTVTRLSDSAVLRYRVVEIDVWSLSQANSRANLTRIYGPTTDGLSRVTLITCTGHWNGYEYDHRFVAFAVLES